MRSKLSRIAENVPKVYAAGKASMVDVNKLIPTNVSGTSISLNDVSKLPHDVSCKVESLNLVKPIDTTKDIYGITFTLNDDNSYTVSGTATSNTNITFLNGFIPSVSQIYVSGGSTNINLTALLYGAAGVFVRYSNNGDAVAIPCKEGDQFILQMGITAGTTYNGTIRPMVSLYYHSTYTPYVPPESVKVIKYGADENEGYQELTPNADGTVDGMKSTSPYMNIKTDTDGVVLNVTYHKSWGMQYEHDRIWDDVQQNGNRTSYHTYFASKGWKSGTTYNPKYPITCVANGATAMFSNSSITDTLVPISISGGNSSVFYGSKIKTIRKLILGSGITTMSDWFNNMADLEDITIEGEIPVTTKFEQSTKLTAQSMVSIVEHLSASASGKTLTLSQTAVNNADWTTTEYNSWAALVAIKPSGWTITLA